MSLIAFAYFVFFFSDTATPEISTLSLHDALPISLLAGLSGIDVREVGGRLFLDGAVPTQDDQIGRATSELQSPDHLVCRLLLEKKNWHIPAARVVGQFGSCLCFWQLVRLFHAV